MKKFLKLFAVTAMGGVAGSIYNYTQDPTAALTTGNVLVPAALSAGAAVLALFMRNPFGIQNK